MQACKNLANPEWPWNSAIKWTKISSKTSGSPDKAVLPGGAGFSGQSTSLALASSQESLCLWMHIQGPWNTEQFHNPLTVHGPWVGRQLPGRLVDLNNKTPMRSCEGTENARWTSPIEGRGLHPLMNRVAAVSWYVRLALILKFLCWVFYY